MVFTLCMLNGGRSQLPLFYHFRFQEISHRAENPFVIGVNHPLLPLFPMQCLSESGFCSIDRKSVAWGIPLLECFCLDECRIGYFKWTSVEQRIFIGFGSIQGVVDLGEIGRASCRERVYREGGGVRVR